MLSERISGQPKCQGEQREDISPLGRELASLRLKIRHKLDLLYLFNT